jgi:hypothetical protein
VMSVGSGPCKRQPARARQGDPWPAAAGSFKKLAPGRPQLIHR